jgi:hypothetical protein
LDCDARRGSLAACTAAGDPPPGSPGSIFRGFAIHASKLWPFISVLRTLEQSTFGAYLHEYGSELKGCKLLDKDRFKWAAQGAAMGEAERRKQALNFLNSGAQKRTPRRDEFTAFGQACLAMAERAIHLLVSYDARVFAAVIPCDIDPVAPPPDDLLRKDLVFLFERFFYFLEERRESGLLVMDGTEKQADRKLVRRVEWYFTQTMIGRQRTQWIVPVPLFVESDMAYGVQVADLCIYCLNWGWRLAPMTRPSRKEVEPFVTLLNKVIWHGDGYRDGKVFRTHGTVYVPDPYTAR